MTTYLVHTQEFTVPGDPATEQLVEAACASEALALVAGVSPEIADKYATVDSTGNYGFEVRGIGTGNLERDVWISYVRQAEAPCSVCGRRGCSSYHPVLDVEATS